MTHTIKNLREGAEYFFRVQAENHAGLSEPKEMIVPVIVKEIQGIVGGFNTFSCVFNANKNSNLINAYSVIKMKIMSIGPD